MTKFLDDLTNDIKEYVKNHKKPTDIVVSLNNSNNLIENYILRYISLHKEQNITKTREKARDFVKSQVLKLRPIKQPNSGGYAIILFNNYYLLFNISSYFLI